MKKQLFAIATGLMISTIGIGQTVLVPIVRWKNSPDCVAISVGKDTLAILNNPIGDQILQIWEKTCKYTKKTSSVRLGPSLNLTDERWETNVRRAAINKRDSVTPPKYIIKIEAMSLREDENGEGRKRYTSAK